MTLTHEMHRTIRPRTAPAPIGVLWACAGMAALASGAFAQAARNKVNVPMLAAVTVDKLVTVLAPGARTMAVHDAGSVLVVGVTAPSDPGSLLVFPLNAQGLPAAAEPARIVLPRPASLAGFRNFPTAITTHPRLPLVYVWQDIVPHEGKSDVPPAPAVHRDFDHLLIYRVNAGTLELVKATARGEWYFYNLAYATLATDATAQEAPDDRLYLPNLQKPSGKGDGTYLGQFGYVGLGTDGLPLVNESGGLALVTLYEQINYHHFDRPMGLVPYSKKTVFAGAVFGIATFTFEGLGFANLIATEANAYPRITGHPTLPVLYGIMLTGSLAHRVEHVEGYLTMIPQMADIGGASFQSMPVFDAKGNRLVVGGRDRVHLIAVDAEGRFTGTQEQVEVKNPTVFAVAYSTRFDRIYVPVEKTE